MSGTKIFTHKVLGIDQEISKEAISDIHMKLTEIILYFFLIPRPER